MKMRLLMCVALTVLALASCRKPSDGGDGNGNGNGGGGSKWPNPDYVMPSKADFVSQLTSFLQATYGTQDIAFDETFVTRYDVNGVEFTVNLTDLDDTNVANEWIPQQTDIDNKIKAEALAILRDSTREIDFGGSLVASASLRNSFNYHMPDKNLFVTQMNSFLSTTYTTQNVVLAAADVTKFDKNEVTFALTFKDKANYNNSLQATATAVKQAVADKAKELVKDTVAGVDYGGTVTANIVLDTMYQLPTQGTFVSALRLALINEYGQTPTVTAPSYVKGNVTVDVKLVDELYKPNDLVDQKGQANAETTVKTFVENKMKDLLKDTTNNITYEGPFTVNKPTFDSGPNALEELSLADFQRGAYFWSNDTLGASIFVMKVTNQDSNPFGGTGPFTNGDRLVLGVNQNFNQFVLLQNLNLEVVNGKNRAVVGTGITSTDGNGNAGGAISQFMMLGAGGNTNATSTIRFGKSGTKYIVVVQNFTPAGGATTDSNTGAVTPGEKVFTVYHGTSAGPD